MRDPKRHLVREKGALRVLASPLRQEIVDVLGRLGETNVSALAKVLNRSADGLYYHLRLLKQAGLVRMSEGSRGEPGARVAPVAPRLAVGKEQLSADRAPELSAIVTSMLRLGARDYRRALAQGETVLSGRHRELIALRTTGWLAKRDLATANQLLREVSGFISAGRAGGRGRTRLYALTILLTPLDHRRRKPRKKT